MFDDCDIILEVMDARIPFPNKKIEKLNKIIIKVLNKADLVEAEELLSLYGDVYVSSRTRKGLRVLRNKIKEVAKNINKDKIIVCVAGFPNTGKSSLINALRGRHVAGTAPIPGKTKGIQLIKLSNKIYLKDTPGIFTLKDKELLTLIGSYSPEKLDNPIRVALKLIKLIFEDLQERFNIEAKDENEFLEKLSKKWRMPLRDTAVRLLSLWVNGKIKVKYPISITSSHH